jgi:hypothetical protein
MACLDSDLPGDCGGDVFGSRMRGNKRQGYEEALSVQPDSPEERGGKQTVIKHKSPLDLSRAFK